MISNNIQYSTGISPQNQALSTKSRRYPHLPKDELGRTAINPFGKMELAYNASAVIKNLNASERNVLNSLLEMRLHHFVFKDKFEDIYARQSTLARMAGFCRETMNRAVKKLHEIGLIGMLGKKERGANRSCMYYINSLFLHPDNIRALKEVLPALKKIPTKLMVSLIISSSFNGLGNALPHGFFEGMSHDIVNMYNGVIKTPYRNLSPYRPEDRQKERDRMGELVRMAKQKVSAYGREFKKTDKERIMEAQIPEYIRNIQSLNLTEAGMVRLAMYPEVVVKFVDHYVSRSYGIGKPFEYFAKACWEEVKRRKLSVDYGMVNNLTAKYGVTDTSPSLNKQEIIHWHTKLQQPQKPIAYCLKGVRSGDLPVAKQEAPQHVADSRVRDGIRKQIEELKAWKREELAGDKPDVMKELQSTTFSNPFLSILLGTTPRPPSKTETNFDRVKSLFQNHTNPLPQPKTSNSDEISFIPEDSVMKDRDEMVAYVADQLSIVSRK